MALATDPLLALTPEVKPRASAAKATTQAAEPRPSEASSFAELYARERQAKPVERPETKVRQQRDDAAAPERAQQPEQPVAAQESELADDGKALPGEENEPSDVDAALLLGLAGQLPVAEETPLETGGAALSAASLIGAAPAGMTEASHDPQIDLLNDAANLQVTLGATAKAQTAQAAQAAAANAPQQALADGPDFAAALAATVESAAGQGEAELSLDEAEVELDGLLGSRPEMRSESLAARLTQLGQAIQQVTPIQRPVEVPGQPLSLQQGNLSEALVDKVMWLSSQNLKSAEIQLDPAELGRLEVRIQIVQDQAQVSFASANAGVRDALEGQLHRLREMFAQQGMNMLDVNVSDQSLSRGWQDQGEAGGRGVGSLTAGGEPGDEELTMGVSEIRSAAGGVGRGLVDYYA